MNATRRSQKRYLRQLDKELNRFVRRDPALAKAFASTGEMPKQGRVEAFLTYCDNSRYPYIWGGVGLVCGLGGLFGAWSFLMWMVNSGMRGSGG